MYLGRSPDRTSLEQEFFLKRSQIAADHATAVTFLCECFDHDLGTLIERVAEAITGLRATVDFQCSADVGDLGFVLIISSEIDVELSFRNTPLGDSAPAFVDRFAAVLQLIKVAARESVLRPGSVIVNLGDCGGPSGVTFCGNARPSFLIPDSYFLASNAYQYAKDFFAAHPVTWAEREEKLFFRGSTTGLRTGSDVLSLPRVKLCTLAKGDPDRYDCKISQFAQISKEEAALLTDLGLNGEYVEWSEMRKKKYHIDIDGNTNSWPGLYLKLLSGGLVFKVRSPHGFRQWYYDELKDRENIVFINSDLSDLDDKLDYYSNNDQIAEEVAARGAELALAMTLGSEIVKTSSSLAQAAEQVKTLQLRKYLKIVEMEHSPRDLHAQLVQLALSSALFDRGKLSTDLRFQPGGSGRQFRVFINNLIQALPNSRYMEICDKPSLSLACAAYLNELSAFGLYNGRQAFQPENLKFSVRLDFDCADKTSDIWKAPAKKRNILFYDGDFDTMESDLTRSFAYLATDSIFICDDINWQYVRACAERCLRNAGFSIKYCAIITTTSDDSHPAIANQHSDWHNGCGVYCIRKAV